jgi:5-methylcytosine-specific restriction endonuclease McrA
MSDSISQDVPQKQCTQCGQSLPASSEYFHARKDSKDGLVSRCKMCVREYGKQHREAHKEKFAEIGRQYREAHKEELAEKKRQYAETHKDQIRERQKQYREAHKEELDEKQRQYAEANKERIREYKRAHYQKNKSRLLDKDKQYYQLHQERIREQQKQYSQAHKSEISQKNRQYFQAHRDLFRAHRNKYYHTDRGRLVSRANLHKRRARKKSTGGSYTAQQLLDQKKRQRSRCYYCSAKLGRVFHADHIVPLSRGGSSDISNIVITCPTCNMQKGSKLPHEWGRRLL